MKIVTDPEKIEELLERGVEQILPGKDEFRKKLLAGERLTLYQGFDPTGSVLHLGHLAGLRKLRDFQELGHEVIFLVGDGTGQAGDPSGKTKARDVFFTKEELKKNAEGYLAQAGRVLRFDGPNPAKVLFNSDWLEKLTFREILEIVSHFTLQQLSERSLFQERIAQGEPVNLREFLYPVLQGYDSVAMNVDLEIGGSDQLFNMLAGRTLVRAMKGKEKFVLTIPLLTDASGRKIGKTEGNVIGIADAPKDLYGKVMSLPDEVVARGLEYLTLLPWQEIQAAKGEPGDPFVLKKRLAFEITKFLNDEGSAREAENFFEETFQRGAVPEEIPEETVETGDVLSGVLQRNGLVSSKSDYRRLLLQRAVEVDGEIISDIDMKINRPITVRIGKHRFLKIKVK